MKNREMGKERDDLRLRLRNIDDGTRHAANKYHASGGLSLHEVLRDTGRKHVCPIYVDSPKLAHAVDWVIDGIEVLGEAGRCYQTVDLSVLAQDFGNASLNRYRVRNISAMSSYFGNSEKNCQYMVTLGRNSRDLPARTWVFLLKSCHQLVGLQLRFFVYAMVSDGLSVVVAGANLQFKSTMAKSAPA